MKNLICIIALFVLFCSCEKEEDFTPEKQKFVSVHVENLNHETLYSWYMLDGKKYDTGTIERFGAPYFQYPCGLEITLQIAPLNNQDSLLYDKSHIFNCDGDNNKIYL